MRNLLAGMLALFMVAPVVAADRVMSMSATSTVSASPDEGYITAGFAVVKPTAADALKSNADVMNKVFATLEDFGVEKKYIRTSNFSIREHYRTVTSTTGNLSRQVKDGYQVSNMVNVTVCELDMFGKVLDTIVTSGANRVHSVSFGSSKAKELTDKARMAACKEVRLKAVEMAGAMGVALGPIRTVSERSVRPRAESSYLRSADAAGGNTPVSGGTLAFTATVNVVWELEAPTLRPHRTSAEDMEKLKQKAIDFLNKLHEGHGARKEGAKVEEKTSGQRAHALIVKQQNVGILATKYTEDGTPYGSVTPFALDAKGNPVVLLSDMSVHTDNIKAESKCSLLVTRPDPKGNTFRSARATLMGKMVKIPDKELEDVEKLYLKKHPGAKIMTQFADFNFYRLETSDIYFIGGFADAGWLDMKEYLGKDD